jgi:hypothetical protein
MGQTTLSCERVKEMSTTHIADDRTDRLDSEASEIAKVTHVITHKRQ